MVLLAIAACRPTGGSHEAIALSPEEDFKRFTDSLPFVKLPYKTSCEDGTALPIVEVDSVTRLKYVPEGLFVFGKIGLVNEHLLLLGGYPADNLVMAVLVYDRAGKKLDERHFMTGYCGGDIDYYGKENFIISKDYLFTEIDTSYYIKWDTISYQRTDTERIEIDYKVYRVTNAGRIEYIEN